MSDPFTEESSSAPVPAEPTVDGITTAQPTPAPAPPPKPMDPVLQKEVTKSKKMIMTALFTVYGIYALWCFVLMAVLPSPTGELQWLKQAGFLVAGLAVAVLVLTGLFLISRILRSDVPIKMRQSSLIRVILSLVPGLFLSIITPLMILRSPMYTLDITPSNSSDLVAPLSITFSAARAVAALQKLGHTPVQYVWDTNADGKVEETTMDPQTTLIYQRAGSYTVSVRVEMEGSAVQRISRSVIIAQEVFSMMPMQPIVQMPVQFSVSNLLTDPKSLKDVQWDFDGDGIVDETSTTPDAVHTYYTVGEERVTALVELTTNTQRTFQRVIDVKNPPPLPFPITLKTDPKNLTGPVPFGVLFSVSTKEPLQELDWVFGDGKEERGADLQRIGHTFRLPGTYNVTLKARSGSGKVAELSTLVMATKKLTLSDLSFSGQPNVINSSVSGQVPLTVELTPQTSMPLIQFSWEAPEDTDMQVSGNTFQAVYRKEGVFLVTLIAQDADGNAMRYPITVNVSAADAEPAIMMKPEGGSAPLHVQLDASDTYIPNDQTIAGFEWRFGDEQQFNTNPELGGSRVEHTYTVPGEYHVLLTVVMTSGKSYTAEKVIIVRQPVLSACLTASRTTVGVGKGVSFDSSCTTGSPTSVLWNIHAANNPNIVLAESPNPTYVHVFDQPGQYVVTLTVQNGSSTDAKSITITVTP